MYTYKHILKLKPFLPHIVFSTLFIWIFTYYFFFISYDTAYDHQRYFSNDGSGYLIQTSGCLIPEMYIRGPEVDRFMDYSQKVHCKSKWNNTLKLYTSNLTSLLLNKEAWASLKIKEGDPAFKCYYSSIKRPEFRHYPTTKDHYDDQVILGEKKYFVGDTTVLDEMIEVTCTLNESVIYQDYHIFIRPKHKTKIRNDTDISVFILGLDGVSRINFHRHMPKTMTLLSQLNSVEMLGYNKVKWNSFPNLIPVLSGLSENELKNHCWTNENDYFDKCHFVWSDYKNSNFSTAFIEDTPDVGLFQHLKYGFLNKPTDYYLRPLMIRAEGQIGNEYKGYEMACIGNQLGMTFLLNHAFKIAQSMSDHLYMGMFWSNSLTHDFIEFPRFGDDDLSDFFDTFNKSSELNKTIVILMSDHGMRFGKFRETYQGSQEDRLPMLKFIIPKWFTSMYPKAVKNLNDNTRRLTTPYDLHETLLDLADPVKHLDDTLIKSRTMTNPNKRGISLFLEIPENRTCKAAGVPKAYCACHNVRETLAVDDANVIKTANVLIDSINMLLSIYPMCANLKLDQIHKASVETGSDKYSIKDYELQVTTVPGYAKFEAVVRQSNGHFNVVGSISRLNFYGLQSVCVNDTQTRVFCYCMH